MGCRLGSIYWICCGVEGMLWKLYAEQKGCFCRVKPSAEAAEMAVKKHSHGVKSMLVWRAGKAQGVPSIDAQGCSCSSKGTSQRARRSLMTMHAARR